MWFNAYKNKSGTNNLSMYFCGWGFLAFICVTEKWQIRSLSNSSEINGKQIETFFSATDNCNKVIIQGCGFFY